MIFLELESIFGEALSLY